MRKGTLGWMAAVLLCSGCSQAGSVVGKAPPDLAMPEQIDVVFNHNAASRYRSPLTGDWRNGDDIEAWLIAAIDAANEEVLVAVQELSLPGIARALIAAEQQAFISLWCWKTYSSAWSEQRPSRLNQRERQRWNQLNRLADSDGWQHEFEEAFRGDAVHSHAAHIPLIDDTEDGSSGAAMPQIPGHRPTSVITGSANHQFRPAW